MEARRLLVLPLTIAAVGVLAWLVFFRAPASLWTISGATMGTLYSVKVGACPSDCEGVQQRIEERLVALNESLSHYDPESQLSAFNRYTGADWFPVSGDLYNVVAYARVISRQHGGVFDVTLAPVIAAWGFGAEDVTGLPKPATIRSAMRTVGYEKVTVDHDTKALRKSNPLTRLDLSAIAKGYSVDQLALMLTDLDIDNYLVEIGGEVRAAGARPGGRPWRIGIESPDEMLDIDFVVSVDNESIASSGDYRNFFVIDGKRYSHTIDPRTGWPVEHELAAVTVIKPSAAEADALATVLMVLGPQAGFEYAEQSNLPALFFVRQEATLAAFYTAEFARYLPRD